MEAVLLVTNVTNGLARSGLELRRVDDVVAVLVLLHQARRKANFAGDDDAVGGRESFAGNAHSPRINAGLGSLAVDEIDDLIGNTVTNLVGMAFGNRLAGEQVTCAHYGIPLKEIDEIV
ncbi:Uncharacterised protein [Mycobacterium tuberculosis]|nr:Uncharacterised protein [Mycobacterium tuberculosis]